MRSATAIMVLMLLGSPAIARAGNCADLQTQMEMNGCASNDFQASDGQLNAVYQRILGRLHAFDAVKQRLVASEQAWIRFRDAECSFATSATEGGTAHSMLATMCKTAMTKDRTKRLTGYLSCRDGDLSCPVPPE